MAVSKKDVKEIVKAYGKSEKWDDIAIANNLWNPDLLYVGQELVIPR